MKFKEIKNISRYIFICFVFLFSSISASADTLFGKDYYKTLHKHLSQANDSISIAMYFIIIDPEDRGNPINVLVDDLISAKKRGMEAARIGLLLKRSKLKEAK